MFKFYSETSNTLKTAVLKADRVTKTIGNSLIPDWIQPKTI